MTWTYDVTNPGNEPLKNVVVTDDNGTPDDPADDFHPTVLAGGFNVGDTNSNGLLDPGEDWRYTANGAAQAGQYENLVVTTAAGNISNTPVTATASATTSPRSRPSASSRRPTARSLQPAGPDVSPSAAR